MVSYRGFIPLGTQPGDTPPHPECGVCGSDKDLTWAHVPAQTAGNDSSQTSQAIGLQHSGDGQPGRPVLGKKRRGGIRVKTHCRTCNCDVISVYDERFGWFVDALAQMAPGLATISQRLPRNGPAFAVDVPDAYPGSVIRSLLGGFMAIAPSLRHRYPEFADAVRNGAVHDWPSDVDLRFGFFPAGHAFVAGTVIPVTVSLVDGTSEAIEIDGIISFPPFYAVLCGTNAPTTAAFGHLMPIGTWLLDEPAVRRTVCLLAPIVGRDESFQFPLDPHAGLLDAHAS